VNEAKNSHLWIRLDLSQLAMGALHSYCRHVSNHLACRLCPSKI